MSFNITFYTFAKKENSTARPSGGDLVQCRLKDTSGIINPRIELLLDASVNPSAWNYCHIPDFHRYYFVREWTFENRLWVARLEVDVLASWKTEIGNSVLYVTRAASDFDPAVIDTYYPAKEGSYFANTGMILERWVIDDDISLGCYVIGVINNEAVDGTITYYLLTGAEMAAFRAYMLSNIKSWDSISDFTGDVAKAFIDPFQYVVSTMWYPFDLPAGDETTISFGFWNTDISAHTLRRTTDSLAFILQRPARADNGSRGNWLYLSPFARYYLVFYPWGVIPIDSTVIGSQIHLDVKFDYITGIGILEIARESLVGASRSGTLISSHTTQIGVPFQLSQITTDYGGILSSANNIVGSIAKGMIGDVGGAILGTGSAIGSAVDAVSGDVSTSGTMGSIVSTSLGRVVNLVAVYMDPVDEDNSEQGRPLCQNRSINTLSGYIKVEHGDVSIPATAEELGTIRLKLEGGFYYE